MRLSTSPVVVAGRIRTEEVVAMKTMAIRLDEPVSATLTMIAQLEETSVAELIREAITTLIGGRKAGGALSAKADEVMAQIEREAAERRQAIQALVNGGTTDEPRSTGDQLPGIAPTSPRRGRRSPKAGS
jgi:hypothetical protein